MTNIIQTNVSKLQKIVKYILMGLIIVLAIKYIPDNKIKNNEIIMIGAISSITFAILDMISPSVSIHNYKKSNDKLCIESFKY